MIGRLSTLRRLRIACLIAASSLLAAFGCSGRVGVPPSPVWSLGDEPPVHVSTGSPIPTSRPKRDAPLAGAVVDPAGKPAPGVKVVLRPLAGTAGDSSPVEVLTDADGSFAFEAPPLGPANLEITRSDDYKIFRSGLVIRSGAALDLGTLQLEPTGEIQGRLVPAEGRQTPSFLGTTVYIPNSSFAARADESGYFLITGVPPGTYDLVAKKAGLGAGHIAAVAVRPAGLTMVPHLSLSPLTVVLTAVDPPDGAPGMLVTIFGENFEAARETGPVSVFFNGVTAASASVKDDRTMTAVVPDGASSGPLVASTGLVRSDPISFQVAATLAITPESATLLVGKTSTLSPEARDSAGVLLRDPPVHWSIQGPAAVVDAGVLQGLGAGDATVSCVMGALTATASVQVVPGSVAGVEVASDTVVVGRFGDDVAIRALTRMADGATHSFLRFEPDDPTLIAVDASGSVVPSRPDAFGSTSVTVTSLLDPSKAARVGVVLRHATFVTTVATGDFTVAVAVDGRGNRYEASRTAIRRVSATGAVAIVAGAPDLEGFQDGTGAQARFSHIQAIASDPLGNLVVADKEYLRRVNRDGTVQTVENVQDPSGRPVAPGPGWPSAVALAADGRILTSYYAGYPAQITPYNVLRGLDVELGVMGLAVDPTGGIFAATRNSDGNKVWRLSPDATLLAGGDPGFADATGTSARFIYPLAIAADVRGNVYLTEGDFVDSGQAVCGCLVRKVSPTGAVTTLAGRLPGHRDGPGELAEFAYPVSIAVSPDGSQILVADRPELIGGTPILAEKGYIRQIAFSP